MLSTCGRSRTKDTRPYFLSINIFLGRGLPAASQPSAAARGDPAAASSGLASGLTRWLQQWVGGHCAEGSHSRRPGGPVWQGWRLHHHPALLVGHCRSPSTCMHCFLAQQGSSNCRQARLCRGALAMRGSFRPGTEDVARRSAAQERLFPPACSKLGLSRGAEQGCKLCKVECQAQAQQLSTCTHGGRLGRGGLPGAGC